MERIIPIEPDNVVGLYGSHNANIDLLTHIFSKLKIIARGNELVVWSPQVSMPIASRYAWANNPPNNLRGIDNLPVAPFRTDR